MYECGIHHWIICARTCLKYICTRHTWRNHYSSADPSRSRVCWASCTVCCVMTDWPRYNPWCYFHRHAGVASTKRHIYHVHRLWHVCLGLLMKTAATHLSASNTDGIIFTNLCTRWLLFAIQSIPNFEKLLPPHLGSLRSSFGWTIYKLKLARPSSFCIVMTRTTLQMYGGVHDIQHHWGAISPFGQWHH